jgi:hypothetical protein
MISLLRYSNYSLTIKNKKMKKLILLSAICLSVYTFACGEGEKKACAGKEKSCCKKGEKKACCKKGEKKAEEAK